jgi:predicted secreted protein
MSWFEGIIVYVLVWWVTLFAVLPLWVQPADPDDPGHASGAPRRPHLLRKAAVTTALAGVIWLAIFMLIRSPWLSVRTP